MGDRRVSQFQDNAGRKFFDGLRLGDARREASPALRYQRLEGATTRTTATGSQIIVGFVARESFAAKDAARATAHHARIRVPAASPARPRASARRREHRSHRRVQSPSRGDPDLADQLRASLIEFGEAIPLDIERASFRVKGGSLATWNRALHEAQLRGDVELFYVGCPCCGRAEAFLRAVA